MNSSPPSPPGTKQTASMTLEGCGDRLRAANTCPNAIPRMTKPEHPRTAYNLFVQDKQREIRAMRMSRNTVNRLNIPGLISDWWQNITPGQRAHYAALADQDRSRYLTEIDEYQRRINDDHTTLSGEDPLCHQPMTACTEGHRIKADRHRTPLHKVVRSTSHQQQQQQPQRRQQQHTTGLLQRQVPIMSLQQQEDAIITELEASLDKTSLEFLLRALR